MQHQSEFKQVHTVSKSKTRVQSETHLSKTVSLNRLSLNAQSLNKVRVQKKTQKYKSKIIFSNKSKIALQEIPEIQTRTQAESQYKHSQSPNSHQNTHRPNTIKSLNTLSPSAGTFTHQNLPTHRPVYTRPPFKRSCVLSDQKCISKRKSSPHQFARAHTNVK